MKKITTAATEPASQDKKPNKRRTKKTDVGPLQPEVTTPSPEQVKERRSFIEFGISTAILIVVLGAVWLAGNIYGMHFRVGSLDFTAHTSDTMLRQSIDAQANAYRLVVGYPNGTHQKYALSEMGITPNATATVVALRHQQHSLFSRLFWWRPMSEELRITSDATKLHAFIANHTTVTIQPAKDATLMLVNGNVQVSDATAGKEYGLLMPAQSILDNVSQLQNAAVHLKTLALNPAITTQELASSKAKLDKTLQQHIVFTIASHTVSPSQADIATWLELTPQDKNRSVAITVNSGKVLSYINAIAAKYIQPPRAEIDITRDDGSKSVLVPGVDGVDVVNKDSVATNIASNLLADNGMQISLPVDYAPFTAVSAGNYDKWIEVDVTNKRMYAYEQNVLVKTFLTSSGAPATPTVIGQYAIYAKYTQQDMRGSNVDGSTYFQPNVPWVNYFYKDYAIHGNYWRPLSYFGNINSSHGCVGITPSDGEWVYDWAPIGTTVIIHK